MKKTLKKMKQGLQTLQTGKGGSSRGGTPATTRASTPMPETRSEPSSLAADPGALPAISGSQLPSGTMSSNPPDDPTIIQQVRVWWKENRGTILASAQFVFGCVEKGLDGVPVVGPKAVFGGCAELIKAVRTLDENHASAEEIAEAVEKLNGELAQYRAPTLPDLTTVLVSDDMSKRVEEFNKRLTEIKTSVSAHPTTWKNVLFRLMAAERIAGDLKDVWDKIQFEYSRFNALTGLSTECKIDEAERRRLIDRLTPALSALHDDGKAAPSCLEDTRVELLAEVAKWMADPSTEPVYWLKGMAGTGKTTIAQSVAFMADPESNQKADPDAKKHRRLFGSFFFSRTGAAERQSATAVIPTLAYQLALHYPPFYSRLCDAIKSKPDIFRKKVEDQARVLLTDASANLPCYFLHPLVVVIDALDECDKQQGVEGGNLIPVLLRALQDLPFCVKIFITSRPKSSIENMFGRADLCRKAKQLALHRDIEDQIARGDIGRYLRHEFGKIVAEDSRVTVPPSFPLEEQFVALQDRADTLFIYARTALEYISDADAEDPRRQIALLLSADSHNASHRFGTLDGLYKHVVREVLEGSRIKPQDIRDVLASIVLLRETMTAAALAALDGIEEHDCRAIIRSLASVLLFDREFTEPIRPIHLSFSDFLLDRDRSTDAYAVDKSTHHLRIAVRCLQIMNKHLRMDICDIRDSSLFNIEVADLDQRLAEFAPPQLRYACRFWHVHLELADTALSDSVASHLEEFCKKHLLHWLELLSLLNDLPVVLPSVPSFLVSLHRFERFHDTYSLLSDAMRLAAAYQIPVTASALHVYHSAVVTMPLCRLREETLGYLHIPVLISERPTSWPRILEGHTRDVQSVAFSCDGQYIVSGSLDSTVRVWDTATGIQLRIMTDHEDGVTSVMFCGSGKELRVVSGSWDCTVRVWDTTTGVQLCSMKHKLEVTSVAASQDSQLVVSGSGTGTIRVWDLTAGTSLLVVQGHDSKINSIGISNNNKSIVSGSADRTVRVWDSATGMQRFTITDHPSYISSVAFSGDGRFFVSASHGDMIRVWNADTGTQLSTVARKGPAVLSFALSRHTPIIASLYNGSKIQLWDATTGHLQQDIETSHSGSAIVSIALSDDGKFLAAGARDGTIWVSEIAMPTNSDAQPRIHTGHTRPIESVAVSGDGTLMVSGSWDGKVKLWSAVTGLEMITMSGHTNWVYSVAISEDSKLVASGSEDRTVRLWEISTGTELNSFTGHEYPVISVALSRNSKLVASGCQHGTVRVWDVVTNTHLCTMSRHEHWVRSVAFSDDSSLIVSGSYDETIRIWDAATGAHLHTIAGHTDWWSSVSFSADGSFILSSSTYDGTVRVWEASTVIATDSTCASLPQYVEAPDSPRCGQFKLDGEGWISRLSSARSSWQRLCWLPTQRRTYYHMAHSGQTVCIGAWSGEITILDFSQVIIS